MLGNQAFSCTLDGKVGFYPRNSLQIPVAFNFRSNITRETYEKILANLETLYSDEVKKKKGQPLTVVKAWESPEVNAYAYLGHYRDVRYVKIHGGLARHAELTEDGLAAVVCHEIGHHIGGAPLKEDVNTWAAAEGQADYFTTLKCLRKLWQDSDNVKVMQDVNIPSHVTISCAAKKSNKNEIALCERGALAGLSTARLLSAMVEKDPNELSFLTPDPSEVHETIFGSSDPAM